MAESEIAKIVLGAVIFGDRTLGGPWLLKVNARVNASLSLPFCVSAALRLCV